MRIIPLGDSAILAELGSKADDATARAVNRLTRALVAAAMPEIIAVVPSYTTVVVHFEIRAADGMDRMRVWLKSVAAKPGAAARGISRTVDIPVCYGGEYGPDLHDLAAHAGLTPAQAIALHQRVVYDVRTIGFLPGFPYLAGLPVRLHCPRKKTPRIRVPAGSVGIGGSQTGVYPLQSPGGWNLIGRTPLRLFRPGEDPPVLLQSGDRVRFSPITPEEFTALSRKEVRTMDPGESQVLRDTGRRVSVEVPGLQTTIQDLGRPGWQRHGISSGGAMDRLAARLANLLVGNPEGAALLECTIHGPTLKFRNDAMAVVTGARVSGVPYGRPFAVKGGTTLSLETLESGCRAYLALAGGLAVPEVLGSRSTLLQSGLGGLVGRALRAGDELPIGVAGGAWPESSGTSWFVDAAAFHGRMDGSVARIVRGPQSAWFPEEVWSVFLSTAYRVSRDSDRMGLRLEGSALGTSPGRNLLSEAMAAGSIQVPPDGLPIVLGADRQTIGGYPKIANVISVDQALIAQLRPGDPLRFELVTLAEARRLKEAQEDELARLRVGLRGKFR